MQPFKTHRGTAVPLRRRGVDTDQIIPAEYLKRVARSGFEDALFAAWRREPSFVLNDPCYAGASVLLADPDFGIGSSREHAVWALQNYGFRAVVSARFGDIFRQNALKNGLLPVQLDERVVSALMDTIEHEPGVPVVVDLWAKVVRVGDIDATFDIDDDTRRRLMEGLDDIAVTLTHERDITRFEAGRPAWLPATV